MLQMCPFLAFEGERTLVPLFCSRAFPCCQGLRCCGQVHSLSQYEVVSCFIVELGGGTDLGLQLLVLRFLQAPAILCPPSQRLPQPCGMSQLFSQLCSSPPGRCSLLPVFKSMLDVCAGSTDMSVCPCQGSFDCECDNTHSPSSQRESQCRGLPAKMVVEGIFIVPIQNTILLKIQLILCNIQCWF